MGRAIFTRRNVFTIIGITVCIGIAALIPGVERYLKGTGIDNIVRQEHYQKLVVYQLQSEWECLPDSEQEAFVLRIMKRFRPDDWILMESGRKWKQDYDEKQRAGTLTVEERKHMEISYSPIAQDIHNKQYAYHSVPWGGVSSSGYGLSPYLQLSKCVISPNAECTKPRFSFSTNQDSATLHVEYENDYARWELTWKDWADVLHNGEYYELWDKWKINQAIATIEKQKQRDDAFEKEAQDTILKMSAADIPSHTEESTVKQEYLRLKCKAQ